MTAKWRHSCAIDIMKTVHTWQKPALMDWSLAESHSHTFLPIDARKWQYGGDLSSSWLSPHSHT